MPSEAKVGVTPYEADVERSDGTVTYVVRKSGYADARAEIDLRTGSDTDLELHKAKGAKSSPPTTTTTPVTTHTSTRKKGDTVDPFAK
jgi:hypothetical protein